MSGGACALDAWLTSIYRRGACDTWFLYMCRTQGLSPRWQGLSRSGQRAAAAAPAAAPAPLHRRRHPLPPCSRQASKAAIFQLTWRCKRCQGTVCLVTWPSPLAPQYRCDAFWWSKLKDSRPGVVASGFEPGLKWSTNLSCQSQCATYRERTRLSCSAAQLDANGDEYGTLDPVSVTLDNATTSAYSLVNIVAADRKGLFYDLMRTLKDIHLRVAYAKVPPHNHKGPDSCCEILVFCSTTPNSEREINQSELQVNFSFVWALLHSWAFL